MNGVQLQSETPSNHVNNNAERMEKDFHFKEKFTIEDLESLNQYYFQSLTTNNGVKFKFMIRKTSKHIKFLILKESVSKQCSATIELILTNPNTKNKITHQVQHDFNIDSRIAEIAIELTELQPGSNFFETNNSSKPQTLQISLTLDHHPQQTVNSPIIPEINERQKKKSEDLFQLFELEAPRIRRQTPSEYYTFTADQYCGIKNQGSTCFLNSILQAFYHLPIFRRLLFQIDVDKNADHQSNIIWNLRQLFAQMSDSTEPVSTRQLTNSFGWNDNQVVDSEQDLFEFYGRILDLLDEKLKRTRFEGEIRKIFYGKARNYIRCTIVPEDKSSIESFNNISLEIRKFKNIEESLREHIKPELQTGENRIQTNNYGLQEAEIGVEFLEFPLVIYFRLNRIDYNPKKGKTVRNNSKCEFPISLDMKKFLAQDSPQQSEDMIYELFGVLVHAGEVNSGHFYAFLRTNLNDGIDKWYKFNDSQVSTADRKQAVIDNFGGKKNDERQHYSAYILIYMRRKELSNLFCPVDTNLLSGYIYEADKNDASSEETMIIQLYTINHIDPETFEFIKPNEVKVPLSYTFKNLYKSVSKRLKMDDILMWYCYKNNLFGEIEYTNDYEVKSIISSSLFVDNFNGIKNDLLIFIEFYSPYIETPKIRLIKSLSVSLGQPVYSILPILEMSVKINSEADDDKADESDKADDISYLVYIHRNGQTKEVSLFSTFGENLTSNGSFVIFQIAPQSEYFQKADIEINNIHNLFYNNNDLVQKYYDHFADELPIVADEYIKLLNSSINLTICDVFVVDNECIVKQYNNEMTVSIPGLFDFDSLKKYIIKLYKIEFNESLQKVYIYKKNSVCPIIDSKDFKIKDKFDDDNDNKLHVLVTNTFDQKARIELIRNESPLEIITNFFNPNLVAYALFEDQVIFDDIIQFRLLQINTKKETIKTVFNNESLLSELKNPIRIEVVPADQKKLLKNEFLIKCRNVLLVEDKFQNQKPIPSPFLLKVKENEPFFDTKKRIESYIEAKSKNNIRYNLSVKDQPEKELLDDDFLSDLADKSSQITIIHPKESSDAENLMILG